MRGFHHIGVNLLIYDRICIVNTPGQSVVSNSVSDCAQVSFVVARAAMSLLVFRTHTHSMTSSPE